MLLKIYEAGHAVLRNESKTLSVEQIKSSEIQSLIDNMIETLRDIEGVGLAAPQVGQPLRLFIIEDLAKYHQKVPPHVLEAQHRIEIPLKIIINPKLEVLGTNTAVFFEGCLSAPEYVMAVPRATSVRVTGLDREGNCISYTAEGWFARSLQHEFDHVNGVLCIERMNAKSIMSQKIFQKYWRSALENDIIAAFPVDSVS